MLRSHTRIGGFFTFLPPWLSFPVEIRTNPAAGGRVARDIWKMDCNLRGTP
jgi:hypothetical protein